MGAAVGGAGATAAAATASLESLFWIFVIFERWAPATVGTAADTAGTAANIRQNRKLADQDLQGFPRSWDHHFCCHILLLGAEKYSFPVNMIKLGVPYQNG